MVLGALAAGPSPLASGQAALSTAADRLQRAIAAENERLGTTRSGLADAQQRLALLSARAQTRTAQVTDAQNRLIAARIHL